METSASWISIHSSEVCSWFILYSTAFIREAIAEILFLFYLFTGGGIRILCFVRFCCGSVLCSSILLAEQDVRRIVRIFNSHSFFFLLLWMKVKHFVSFCLNFFYTLNCSCFFFSIEYGVDEHFTRSFMNSHWNSSHLIFCYFFLTLKAMGFAIIAILYDHWILRRNFFRVTLCIGLIDSA